MLLLRIFSGFHPTQLAKGRAVPLIAGVRFATKKAGGTTRNGRSTAGKRLGVKKFGGEAVIAGNIIIRQVVI